MASAYETAVSFDMGRVLSRAFGAIGRNFALFFGLSLVLAGIPQLVGGLYGAGRLSVGGEAGAAAILASGLAGILGWLGTTVLQVSLTRATISDLVGEHPTFTGCLHAGLTLLLPVIGLSIVFGLGVGVGTMLLIVPGIMLYTAWSVAVPAYVQEHVGVIESLGRSRNLTRGYRWRVFALLLVCGVLILLLQAPVGLLAAVAQAGSLAAVVIGAIASVAGSMVLSTVVAAIYVELRDVQEGTAPSELETIFA